MEIWGCLFSPDPFAPLNEKKKELGMSCYSDSGCNP